MRPMLIAAFLTSTAFMGTAFAQSPPPAPSNAVRPDAAGRTTPDQALSSQGGPTAPLPAGEIEARAAISQCDRLASLIGQSGSAAGVTREQAETWKSTSDAKSCREALDRLDRIGATGATGTGIRPVELQPDEN